ncbi:S8 family peptidase [Stigmatella sp. ncwal1]|uniref:S8 family peptidase n=1 Tax=Stigmatella ashevillensis TaxID=2995309 RepID=A0ABT5DFA0_9BACT|nr:S8 family peptidase [Stigmatella ashevillena]MDC0711002.1 S8 family peptidase [Stigmatella ashevillena]
MAKPFNRPHLFIRKQPDTSPFTSPGSGGGSSRSKARDRATHGAQLKNEFTAALPPKEDEARVFRFEFEGEPGFALELKSLESEHKGIELLNVRRAGDTMLATVLVPRGKLGHFLGLFEDYLTKTRGTKNNPANKSLVESISHVRRASVRSLWTDPLERFPSGEAALWWEVWLRGRQDSADAFKAVAQQAKLPVSKMPLLFTDRAVLNLCATVLQVSHLLERDELIAELREAKTSTAEFLALPSSDQVLWTRDLLARVQAPPVEGPSVCILDTGVNRGHELLGLALPPASQLTVNPLWGVDDRHGHGTQMAGLALYGDLGPVLTSKNRVLLRHGLESVKLFPGPGDSHAPEVYGAVTTESAARAQIQSPDRTRTFCMAVTSPDGHEKGVPSSWSSAVDDLAFGSADHQKRLMCISAGNIDPAHFILYPQGNQTELIRDPGQSWNALTVGAFADRDALSDPDLAGWKPLASLGGLCPSSPTSLAWDSDWPIKPDIVMPGGNAAIAPDGKACDFARSLSLLTTHFLPVARQFSASGETSAATALAARLSARLHAEYAQLWPETVRALLVHSAEWTPEMRRTLPQKKRGRGEKKTQKKGDYRKLLRMYGYGEPQEAAALFSAEDALTLIGQHEIQPFGVHPKHKGQIATRDMHLHALPWPEDVLRDLGETEVELRVTLSYFIEPLPGERGYAQNQRHRYASHGLRFELKAALESLAEFTVRINKAARTEGEGAASESDAKQWLFGPDLRSAGSLHSDRWRGTAVDLANKGFLAVYPTVGWWKERPRLGRGETRTRYALVVSIRTPEVDTDIYTPVAIQLGIPITL